VYGHNNRAISYIKQKLIKLQDVDEIHYYNLKFQHCCIIKGWTQQAEKVSKDTVELSIINQLNLNENYR
jgi:hypothetical protein